MQNALHLGSVLPAVSHECKRLRKNSCITGKTWNLLTMEALFITHYRMVLSVKTLARAAHGSTASLLNFTSAKDFAVYQNRFTLPVIQCEVTVQCDK